MPSPFSPARPVRSYQDIVQQVRDALQAGRLRPGDRLPSERELSESFSVSRSTLREALRALEATGLVEIRLGASGGVFARQPGIERVGDALDAMFWFANADPGELYEFRESFEADTAADAARRATDEDLAAVGGAVEHFEALAADPAVPWADIAAADVAFHEALVLAAHNRVRTAVMHAIHAAFSRTAANSLDGRDTPDLRAEHVRQLRQILGAVVEHDTEAARAAMRRHIAFFTALAPDAGPSAST